MDFSATRSDRPTACASPSPKAKTKPGCRSLKSGSSRLGSVSGGSSINAKYRRAAEGRFNCASCARSRRKARRSEGIATVELRRQWRRKKMARRWHGLLDSSISCCSNDALTLTLSAKSGTRTISFPSAATGQIKFISINTRRKVTDKFWPAAPDSDNAKVFPKASIFNALNASDELLGGEVPVKGCTCRLLRAACSARHARDAAVGSTQEEEPRR
mmetsp:Transcript_18066/g.37804  ORF Transcript_18066/g.37804 Transcript_18066/m.37804 type:complete len:216 (+) Transcript_18066:108-755(+)